MIGLGADRLLAEPRELAGRKYGLLAHAAALTSQPAPLHLALQASSAGSPSVLFSPEHGYYAVEQDMIPSSDQRDPLTGLAVASLYGASAASLRPDPAAFSGLDLLLIDLQDAGSRYYTYAATAVWSAEVALAAGLEVWVLDRPNPLGGTRVEGNLPQPGYESFVSAFRLPVRHGLTLGELMRLEARRRNWADGLRVFPLSGWQRDMLWSETGLPWIAPSPNLPTLTTALVYPGSCLIEATEFSEGRGTTRPFQLLGAPGLDPRALVQELAVRELPGVTFLPTFFRPQFQKHRGEVCAGVELVVTDRERFPPYRCGVELVAALWTVAGEHFAWRQAPYEFVSDRPAIDLLTGGADFRRALAAGHGMADWTASWSADERAFKEERQAILLY